MRPMSLYIHIPFCKQKCLYCDFPSYAGCEQEFKIYVDCLTKELLLKSKILKEYEIKTIFFGGGTPTVLPIKFLNKIIETIFSNYAVVSNAEITIEANPETVYTQKLVDLRKMGFNRISMGVQAWQNRLLKILGRIHTIEKFCEVYEQARKAGFDNINVDLMFSLPSQTILEWEETLKNIIYIEPEHISCYGLIIEPQTPFEIMLQKGKINAIDEITDRNMYELAKELLCKSGYQQYEISNFSQKNKQCLHNIVYWKDEEYIGLGLGAHSYFFQQRFHNTYDKKTYLLLNDDYEFLTEEREKLDLKTQYAEFMFMGLRMTEGIEKKRFFNRFKKNMEDIYENEINRLLKENLIKQDEERIWLTQRGIDISNVVFERFI